ncbi:MAG: pyridoxamine 5'-phosphate oxidase family protein [Gemmatimonadota bacterium]|nr:pyridoxamine 5'-phosphate oxidase family protein [Gemmatimonadota bacterium]
MTSQPDFHTLDRAECEALLLTQQVGRLAFTFRDRVDIEPIHYVYRDGCVYGRTQYGTKVDVLAHHPWVAFEVDAIAALFAWRSVVVHGRIEFPDPAGTPTEVAAYARAVAAFRTLVPGAFSDDDPTPARGLAFVIPVQEMTGRAATVGGTG